MDIRLNLCIYKGFEFKRYDHHLTYQIYFNGDMMKNNPVMDEK